MVVVVCGGRLYCWCVVVAMLEVVIAVLEVVYIDLYGSFSQHIQYMNYDSLYKESYISYIDTILMNV